MHLYTYYNAMKGNISSPSNMHYLSSMYIVCSPKACINLMWDMKLQCPEVEFKDSVHSLLAFLYKYEMQIQ